jgi:CheY-like chemotaxis protein
MDCQMPVVDGYAATEQIRARESGRRIPIVALTAHALAEDRTRCLQVGMDDFITKPVGLDDLRSVLERYVVAG